MYNPNNPRHSRTLKIFKLYKYHAAQTIKQKKIKLVDSISLTCLIFLE